MREMGYPMDTLATFQHKVQHRVAGKLFGEDVERKDGRCRFAPEWLIFCINNFCNLKCRMCDVGIGERESVFFANMVGDNPGTMSFDLLKTALDGATGFRPLPRVGLAFTEPLNHPHIVDFCREVVRRGFFCSMTSNGFLLPQRAEALVEAGLDELNISIDGPPATHDAIRGRKGSFARLYEGVEKVNAAKAASAGRKPVVRISSTISDLNYSQLRATLQEIAPLKPASINFAHPSYITDSVAVAHNLIHPGEMAVSRSSVGQMDLGSIDLPALAAEIAAAREYARLNLPGISLTFHPELSTLTDLVRYYRQPEHYVGGKHCTDPFKMMMIKTDGTVIPAHSRCYNYPLGSVQEQPLTAIWNNARYLTFRSHLQAAGGTLPACTRCCGVVAKPAP
jgi:MoaA/NifB/PqqE/SkfB family radical SAM enzyme